MHFLSGFSLIPEFLTRGIMQEWQACLAEVKFSQREAMPWAVIIPWLIQRSLLLLSSLVKKLAIFSLSQKKYYHEVHFTFLDIDGNWVAWEWSQTVSILGGSDTQEWGGEANRRLIARGMNVWEPGSKRGQAMVRLTQQRGWGLKGISIFIRHSYFGSDLNLPEPSPPRNIYVVWGRRGVCV